MIARAHLAQHVSGKCARKQVSCPYLKWGCKELVTQEGYAQHLVECTPHHLQLLDHRFENTENKTAGLAIEINGLHHLVTQISASSLSLQEETREQTNQLNVTTQSSANRIAEYVEKNEKETRALSVKVADEERVRHQSVLDVETRLLSTLAVMESVIKRQGIAILQLQEDRAKQEERWERALRGGKATMLDSGLRCGSPIKPSTSANTTNNNNNSSSTAGSIATTMKHVGDWLVGWPYTNHNRAYDYWTCCGMYTKNAHSSDLFVALRLLAFFVVVVLPPVVVACSLPSSSISKCVLCVWGLPGFISFLVLLSSFSFPLSLSLDARYQDSAGCTEVPVSNAQQYGDMQNNRENEPRRAALSNRNTSSVWGGKRDDSGSSGSSSSSQGQAQQRIHITTAPRLWSQ